MTLPAVNVDVERALCGWLTASLSARCVTELPADLADVVPLLQVGRLGGVDPVPGIDDATVDVTAFADTYANASALAYRAWTALRLQLPGTSVPGGTVLRVRTLSAPTFHPYDNPAVRRFGSTFVITTQSSS
jgi:hypothetical protein